jgi:SAM-dependent methyltransferase
VTSHPLRRPPEAYARSRAFPPEAERLIGESLSTLLSPQSRVVDLGAGTGRMAHLLLARGFSVWAVDRSVEMLRYLRAHRPSSAGRLQPIQADIERLPLASGWADAVLSVHVLHLVTDAEGALAEASRLLHPQGLFLLGWTDHDPDDPSQRIHERWKTILAGRGLGHPGRLAWIERADAWLRDRFVAQVTVVAAHWARQRAPRAQLDTISDRLHPYFIRIPDDTYRSAFAQLEAWSAAEFPSLDRPVASVVRFVWRVFGSGSQIIRIQAALGGSG